MDPFYEVQQDCRQQFYTLDDFVNRTNPSSGSSNIEALIRDYNTQRTDIIETIDDLRQSVESIQLNPRLYPNIDNTELSKRALEVSKLTEELSDLNDKWNNKLNSTTGVGNKGNKDVTTMSNRISQEFDQGSSEGAAAAASNQFQQQELIREQDEHLENIHQTMQNLHLQATQMGDELEDQHELLQHFDSEMDNVGYKLKNGLKKVDYFLTKNKDRASDCCILLLIVALVILLFILIVL